MSYAASRMNAADAAAPAAADSLDRTPVVGVLRALLLGEAAVGLALTILLSMVASGVGGSTEETIRFAAAGAFLFAIFAAIASRGARRRRSWAWTMAAILQVILAIGTGIAVFVAEWQPAYLIGFGLAVVVMLVLSVASVRRALGQA
jgi:peptidoglycan/LPS O-acetylase OafA/YrhL